MQFRAIPPVTAELFHGTDMTTLIVAFRSFPNAPENWGGGSTNSVEDRENGDLGVGSPLNWRQL